MEARYLNVGDRIDYTPGSAVAAGEVVVVGKVCFVANVPIAANELGSLAARGVFEIAKTDGLAIDLGDAVRWNNSTNKATKTSSDVYFGVCVESAVAGASTVKVLLRSLQEAVADHGLGSNFRIQHGRLNIRHPGLDQARAHLLDGGLESGLVPGLGLIGGAARLIVEVRVPVGHGQPGGQLAKLGVQGDAGRNGRTAARGPNSTHTAGRQGRFGRFLCRTRNFLRSCGIS